MKLDQVRSFAGAIEEGTSADRHIVSAVIFELAAEVERLKRELAEEKLVAASWKREAEMNAEAADRLAETERLLREAKPSAAYALEFVSLRSKLTKAVRDQDQILNERDHAEGMADKLAAAVAALLGVEIGEHSSANCPWTEALKAFEERTADSVSAALKDGE